MWPVFKRKVLRTAATHGILTFFFFLDALVQVLLLANALVWSWIDKCLRLLMLGVARKHKDKNRFDYLSKHFFLCHFTSACVSAELGHGQSSTLQATVMVSEITSTAALAAERLGRSQAKSAGLVQFPCGLNAPLWYLFIYLFVFLLKIRHAACVKSAMCAAATWGGSAVPMMLGTRTSAQRCTGGTGRCWWLLPAPSPWFSLPVAKMLWFSATHLLEGCRGYLNHLQVLTCSPAPWCPAGRRDKWGQQ